MLSELTAALRALARTRGYTVSVVLILALGLGSATGIFSMVERSIFLENSDLPESDRLVRLQRISSKGATYLGILRSAFDTYRKANLTSIAGFVGGMSEASNLIRNDQITPVFPTRVTADFFSVLGLKPKLGRGFLPEDATTNGLQPVVISDSFWRTEFGSDPEVVGRKIRLGERDSVIIGVLPESPRPPYTFASHLYLPIAQADLVLTRDNANLTIAALARLARGATIESAQAELNAIQPDPAFPIPKYAEGSKVALLPHNATPTSPGTSRYHLKNWVLIAAVGLLYLIATVNAGNLMLVRTLGRRRELAVRAALGGNRWRVLRPVLVECLLVTVLALALGYCVAKWFFSLLLALTPAATAAWEPLQLSGRSLWLLGGLGLLVGVLLLVFSWVQISGFNLTTTLKDGGSAGTGRTGRALRDLFVVVQTALAVVLLIGTGLLIRTYAKLLDTDYGFGVENKLMLSVNSPRQTAFDPKLVQKSSERVLEVIRALPGVHSATLGTGMVTQMSFRQKIGIVGAPEPNGESSALETAVGPDFIETLGLRLRAGRSLIGVRPTDPPVAVISEAFARQWFSGENPIGRRIAVDRGPTLEIIGIVGDVRRAREEPAARYYVPYWHARFFTSVGQMVVRLRGEPSPKFEAELRRAIYELDPRLVVSSIRKLEVVIQNDTHNERSALIHFQALGSLALCLAAFGLFAMMSYNVSQRQAEFGIRFALGARPEHLQVLVLRRGLILVLLGLAAGAVLAWNLTRFIQALLFNAPTFDWLTHVVVAVLLVLSGLLACWLPVRRATCVDLARLLRAE